VPVGKESPRHTDCLFRPAHRARHSPPESAWAEPCRCCPFCRVGALPVILRSRALAPAWTTARALPQIPLHHVIALRGVFDIDGTRGCQPGGKLLKCARRKCAGRNDVFRIPLGRMALHAGKEIENFVGQRQDIENAESSANQSSAAARIQANPTRGLESSGAWGFMKNGDPT